MLWHLVCSRDAGSSRDGAGGSSSNGADGFNIDDNSNPRRIYEHMPLQIAEGLGLADGGLCGVCF